MTEPCKFRCKTEIYRHFRGYLFVNHKPTVVEDAATIGILQTHPEFERVDDEIQGQRQGRRQEEVLTTPPAVTTRPVLSLRKRK